MVAIQAARGQGRATSRRPAAPNARQTAPAAAFARRTWVNPDRTHPWPASPR